MKRIRFNIASLLGVIIALGFGIAALREFSKLWESGVFSTTIAVLLVSILLAVHILDNFSHVDPDAWDVDCH
jgi:hypothetical protein